MKESARMGKVLLISILVILAILWVFSLRVTPSENIPPVSQSTPTATVTPSLSATASITSSPSANPATSENNITVTSPTINQEVSSPFMVTGQARVFENVIHYMLKDSDGKVLSERSITYTSPDAGEFGTYSFTVTYNGQIGKKGTLHVFDYSPKDGSRENEIIIPVIFK